MTPETQHTQAHAHAAPNPLFYVFGGYLMFLLVMTPLVAFGWNVGLKGAGIVDYGIGWGTALGLAVIVMILRTIAAGARPSMFMLR